MRRWLAGLWGINHEDLRAGDTGCGWLSRRNILMLVYFAGFAVHR
jgi:hypothetical protein